MSDRIHFIGIVSVVIFLGAGVGLIAYFSDDQREIDEAYTIRATNFLMEEAVLAIFDEDDLTSRHGYKIYSYPTEGEDRRFFAIPLERRDFSNCLYSDGRTFVYSIVYGEYRYFRPCGNWPSYEDLLQMRMKLVEGDQPVNLIPSFEQELLSSILLESTLRDVENLKGKVGLIHELHKIRKSLGLAAWPADGIPSNP